MKFARVIGVSWASRRVMKETSIVVMAEITKKDFECLKIRHFHMGMRGGAYGIFRAAKSPLYWDPNVVEE